MRGATCVPGGGGRGQEEVAVSAQLQRQSARVREAVRNRAAEDRVKWGCAQLQQQGARVIGAARNLGGEGARAAQRSAQ